MLIKVSIKDKKRVVFSAKLKIPITKDYSDFKKHNRLLSKNKNVLLINARLSKKTDRAGEYLYFECVTRNSKNIPKIRFQSRFPVRAVGKIGTVNGQNFDNGRFNKATLTLKIPYFQK